MSRPTGSVWAASIVVPQEFLNGLARSGIGEGLETERFSNTFQLPMMGPVILNVGMTITGVTFEMRAEHPDRLCATIHAAGSVAFGGENPMPGLPGVARVRGDVLVAPVVELHEDGTFRAGLDVAGSELIAVKLEGIDGLDHDAVAQTQMSEMLFAAVGGELFGGLADQLGMVGIDLDAESSLPIVELGVRRGPAVIRVEDGRLVIGLVGVDGLDGHADIVDVTGHRVGVGLASESLSVLCARIASDAIGGPLPWELGVDTSDRRLGARVRSPRLVDSERLPDLRSSLRVTLRPRLVGSEIEIGVREAWIEFPSIIPPVINRLNRWVGGVAARAPLTVRVPATAELPVRPGSDTLMEVVVTAIDVADHGVAAKFDIEWAE